MSRPKRNRAKHRAAISKRPPAAAPAPAAPASLRSGGRVQPARRRAQIAKTTLATGGAAVFGAALLFARVTYAGHPKQPLHPLAAPPRFVQIVRQNLLQAGIVAPAEAPAGAATSVS